MESGVSMDAVGVPPRQQQTDSSIAPTQDLSNIPPRQQHANIEFAPEPPLNWRLNVLLEDIASNIDDKELDRIKILFRGPGGLGKGTLEKCNTFTKLFDILRERGFISRGNLVYLNKILYTLTRPDLIDRAATYCRQEGNVVHYFKEDIETGDIRPKFHVAIDIKDIDMETIDRIRNNVAKIVCAPVECVLIAAVEPGSSLLVTLVLPNMYSQILQDLLETKQDLWELTAVGIDTVVINDKTYSLTGIHEAVFVETEQQRKIMNIYDQLEQARQDLERTEIQAVARFKEIRLLKRLLSNNKKIINEMQTSKATQERKNMELLAACSLLQRMRLPHPDQQGAMHSFRHAISEANIKGQDMNVIKRIVDTNTLVVSSFVRNLNAAERKMREAVWEKRKLKEAEIHHQLLTGSITAEQALRMKFAQYTLDVPIGFNEMRLKIITEVSRSLTEEERKHLMDRYHWEDNDLIKTCVELDNSLLLLGLECKETELTQQTVEPDLFIRTLLKEVSRHDLDYLYVMNVSKSNQHLQNAPFTQAARHLYSQQESSGLGPTVTNEMHQMFAIIKDTLELAIKMNDQLLELSSTERGTTSEYMPYQPRKSFEYFLRPHPMTFEVIGHYAQKIKNAVKNAFSF